LFWILLVVPLMPMAAMIQEHKSRRKRCGKVKPIFAVVLSRHPVGRSSGVAQGKLAIVNPAFCAIFGTPEAEFAPHELHATFAYGDLVAEAPLSRNFAPASAQAIRSTNDSFEKTEACVGARERLLLNRRRQQPFVIGC